MFARFLALLLASSLLFVVLGPGHARVNQAQLPKVMVSQPIAREVTDHTDFQGRVEPSEAVEVRTRVAGEVTEVAFKPGQVVKKGDLLFRLDPRTHKAHLDKAEAEAEQAQAKVRRAAAEFARVKRIAETGAAAKEEVESAAAARADAEAALKGARAEVELARLKLESTRVTAPIAGRAGRPSVVAGAFVTAADHLVSVASTDPVHVTFDLDEGTALGLIRGAKGKRAADVPVQVGLLDEAGLPHRGHADLTGLQFNPGTGTAQGRVVLPNPDGLFLPGMTARVRLVEGKPYKALLVAYRAVLSDAQGSYVLVVNPAGVLERRYVTFGRRQGALLPVKGGLKAEDLVVIDFSTTAGRGRAGDPVPAVGTAVETEKVPMPERASRLESPWGFQKMPQDGKRGGKGKSRP